MARDVELEVTAGSDTLSGTLTLPAAASGPLPAILLLPSFLPRDRDGRLDRQRHDGWFLTDEDARPGILARIAVAAADHGIASMRCDKRGCGRSGGDWATSGMFTLVDDARDALGALRGRPEVDPTRIGLVGHGEGASLAMSVAAADPAVGPLTLIGAPARSLRDVLRRGVAERARRVPDDGSARRHPFIRALDRGIEELIERAERHEQEMVLILPGGRRTILGLAGWEQGIHVSVRALATLQRRSVTLVHGGDDEWVDPAESAILESVLERAGAPYRVVIPGAGHDLAEAEPEVFRDLSADLAARLQPRRLPTVLLSLTDLPPPAG